MKIKFQTVVLTALLLFGLTSATTEMFFADTWAGTASNQGLTFNALYDVSSTNTRLINLGARINETKRLITQADLKYLNVQYRIDNYFTDVRFLSLYSSLPPNDKRVVTKNDIEIGAIAFDTPNSSYPGTSSSPTGGPVMRYSSRNANGQVFVAGCQLYYDRARTLPWIIGSIGYVFLNHPNSLDFYSNGAWYEINASGQIANGPFLPGG